MPVIFLTRILDADSEKIYCSQQKKPSIYVFKYNGNRFLSAGIWGQSQMCVLTMKLRIRILLRRYF